MSCTVRSGTSCNADEVCLFSMWNLTNSHVGQCSYYTNYTVCCTNLTSSAIKTSCDSDEGGVISLYTQNNSHVERYGYGSYSYNLCVKPKVQCTLRTSCLSDETCVISLYADTNSHVAECDTFYSNKVCCKILGPFGVSIVLNATKVWWNDSVLAQGVVLNASGLPAIGVSVNLKLNNVTQCSTTTNSSGGWNCSFTAPNEINIYTVTAETEVGSMSTSLYVAPNYGQRPIGTANRVVFEIPVLIQDLNGKIKQVWARVMIWEG